MTVCLSNHSIPVDKNNHDIMAESMDMLVRAFTFVVIFNQFILHIIGICNLANLLGGAGKELPLRGIESPFGCILL